MARSKITAKYQVTVPKEIRDEIEVKPGEIVTMKALSNGEILLKRFSRPRHPLAILIGKKPLGEVSVEELEVMESR